MRRLARATAAAGFFLVIAGGLVTSTDSGLAVPDWPLSYGSLFPPMVGGIRFEHTHRMIAAAVGILTLILTLLILGKEKRRWVRYLGILAFGMVVVQGILGGLTVLWKLPVIISVAHACLGQTFFATMAVLATVLSSAGEAAGSVPCSNSPPPLSNKDIWNGGVRNCARHPNRLPPASQQLITTGAIYGQLILGATLRHTRWAPVLVATHIFWALVVFVLIMKSAGGVLREHRTEPFLERPARALIWLLLAQMILGFSTLITGAQVLTATGHVAVGALMLAISAVLTVRLSFRGRRPRNLTQDTLSNEVRDLSLLRSSR